MSEIEKKVDESWKEQVERERRQQTGTAPAAAPAGAPPPGASAGAPPPGGAVKPDAPERPAPAPEPGAEPPPAAEGDDPLFEGLVQSLAVQATMFLGASPDPRTGLMTEDPGQAKQLIDMLGMLEHKTRGNLTAREAQLIQMILRDLRMAFVARMQAAQGGASPGAPGAMPGQGPGPGVPPF